MNESVRVLIIEDDPADAELMVRELKRAGFTPEWVRVETEVEYLFQLDQMPDVILSDNNLPLFDGFEALDLLRQRGLDIPFILVSGRVGEDLAVEAMKRGACDYLLKDRLARLGEAVRRALELRRVREEKEWAVEALRQSEERYRLVSEASSDYVYSLLLDSVDATAGARLTCEWITEPFTRITGFTSSEINSNGWQSLYHPDDLSIAGQHFETLLSGQSDSFEARIVTRNKQVRWIRSYDRPVYVGQGGGHRQIERIYGAAQDITIQKHLEEQLLQSRKMEAIGQLAGGVAHDFNNLLTVICGFGDLLSKQPDLSKNSREYSDEILEAARRASQVTRQLLAFGRKQVLQSRNVNLNTVLSGIEKLLQRLVGEMVELKIVPGAELGLVRVDTGQIEQVMMNLAVNARDAMITGGRLTIETANVNVEEDRDGEHTMTQHGPQVLLAVSDTGTGMDRETAARVFEPFFTTKEQGKGTGLGLAMAYGIIKQSGGDIQVESTQGKGTTFRIYLPRLQRGSESPAEASPFFLRTTRGAETILVLEDEKPVRSLIRRVLADEGYRVMDTGEAAEAIRLCNSSAGKIDLFITDVVLPVMSGPQVAQQLSSTRPDMKILYISGYPGHELVGQNQNDGNRNGSRFLEKPFTPLTLLKRVRQTLDATAVEENVMER